MRKKLNNWLKYKNELSWFKKPKIELISNKNYHKRFPDGYLNIYHNCIERFLDKKKNNIAIYTIDNQFNIKSYSYIQIDKLVNKFCSFIFSNIKKVNLNTKIMIHSSAGIESTISMLACAKLGIEFSVLFEELDKVAIKKRAELFKPDLLITKKKNIELDILKKFVKKKTISFEEFENYNFKYKSYKTKKINSDKNFFTIFTSGSTGTPKGIVHSSGGYLLYSKISSKIKFGMNIKSVVLTASDAGWLNGHTYALFGPLSCGSKSILLETPLLMLRSEIFNILNKLNTTIIYLPVTLIRFMREIYKKKKIKIRSLKCLGSMGEPLAKSVGDWLNKFFSHENRSIVNAYYQTENGAIICSPDYKSSTKKFPNGSVGEPLNSLIHLNKLDSNKKEILVVKPWPGCMKNILNGKKIYNSYWTKEGYFRMFDLGTKVNNVIYVHGRTDDVINIRGHRIGSSEVESVILQNKNIKECCAIAVEEKLEGNNLYIFVVSRSTKNDSKINRDLVNNFGSFAIPKKIFYVKDIPKTRSGKILRRLLRNMLIKNDDDFGDLSTILNAKSLNQIKKIIKKNV